MKAFPLRACGMAVGAAVLLGGCSSLPLGDVPIVDRSVPTSGEHTTAGSRSSSFAPLGDVRDSGRTHTVTVGDTIYNISVRYGVTPSALMQLNAVTDPTQLAIGRVLHIPESTAAPREVTMPEASTVSSMSLRLRPQPFRRPPAAARPAIRRVPAQCRLRLLRRQRQPRLRPNRPRQQKPQKSRPQQSFPALA